MNNSNRTQHEMHDLITRFLRHETTAEEIRIIENWLDADPSNRVLFNEINMQFQALSENNQEYASVDDAWSSLSQKLEGADDEKVTRTISISSGFSFMKVAASVTIIMIAAFVTWRYFNVVRDNEQLLVAEESKHAKRQITLSDGTKVWLNVNSSIHYGQDFGKETRTVVLKGEAFFDVTKTGIDFIVQTSNLNIRVKGTRFNVNAFHDERQCATLEEGRVILKVKGSDQSFDMKPGDQVTYDHQLNEVSHKVVHASSFSVWKEEPLKFTRASLSEILRNIETRYQVKITISNTIAERENISMTIQDETLEEVLELISISTSLKYKIDGSEVVMYE